jgi:DNA end-binding protein Ku
MPKAVWTGSISFGLVTLPVRLFPATEPKDIRFHLYDSSGRRIRYRRVVEDEPPWPAEAPAPSAPTYEAPNADVAPPAQGTPTDEPAAVEPGRRSAEAPESQRAAGGEVAWDDVARGVEDEVGRVVLLSRDEYERARPERSRTIDVEDFVRLEDIDPVYFQKSYYLAPASPDAVRPYVLLRRALEDAGRIGIGRFVLRTRPHLVAIRATRGVLGLETLFFGDEVREPSAVVPGVEGLEVSERELELAHRLIETLETEWEPNAYADTYRDELLRMLADKRPTREPQPLAAEPDEDRSSAVEALMAALRESVEAAKARTGKPAKRSTGKRTTAKTGAKRAESATRSKRGA